MRDVTVFVCIQQDFNSFEGEMKLEGRWTKSQPPTPLREGEVAREKREKGEERREQGVGSNRGA